ncbi:hypothetical protein M1P56_19555 [Streptomyces sp. HU2014]|uniref:hypothetical protein n=1 Tax=Streptomyces sp. HU2014 TaxID=2939414 RepID=UPI00200DA68B|nr:hypothetical protein [Streptomyces sp. HU2014]UQI46386.1 hypothetical protein M1P56_19555 [Streptomyces sp. HU2014]
MTSYEAQAALDDIRRLQEHTGDAYVHHGFSRSYVLMTAVTLFVELSSFDLPHPWSTATLALGVVLLAGTLIAQERRAPVRRRHSGRELLLYAVASAVLMLVYLASLATTRAAGLPAPHTVAATAVALASLAGARFTRPLLAAIVRRDSRNV